MTSLATGRQQAVVTREALHERLENARTAEQRDEAIDIALQMGMRLDEIEKYLDWLEASYDSP